MNYAAATRVLAAALLLVTLVRERRSPRVVVVVPEMPAVPPFPYTEFVLMRRPLGDIAPEGEEYDYSNT